MRCASARLRRSRFAAKANPLRAQRRERLSTGSRFRAKRGPPSSPPSRADAMGHRRGRVDGRRVCRRTPWSAASARRSRKSANRFIAASLVGVIRQSLVTQVGAFHLAGVAEAHPYSPWPRARGSARGHEVRRFPAARNTAAGGRYAGHRATRQLRPRRVPHPRANPERATGAATRPVAVRCAARWWPACLPEDGG